MYLNSFMYCVPANCTGLTLTWDVFKFVCIFSNIVVDSRLTLTWDVFKFANAIVFATKEPV